MVDNIVKKSIMRILALVVVCALFVAYGKYVRLQTIKSAELVEYNGAEYTISFDGETYPNNP